MDKETLYLLNSIGMTVTDDNKGHYKLSFNNDDRYVVTISHTPSEFKCGLNAIADINRILF